MKNNSLFTVLILLLIGMIGGNVYRFLKNKEVENKIRFINVEKRRTSEKLLNRYQNFQLLEMGDSGNEGNLEKIKSTITNFESKEIQDSFYLLNELEYLYKILTGARYYGDCGWDKFGFVFSTHANKYYFGGEDRIGSNIGTFQFFCNDHLIKNKSYETIEGQAYFDQYKVAANDTLYLKILKLMVNYVSGDIDTTIAEETITLK